MQQSDQEAVGNIRHFYRQRVPAGIMESGEAVAHAYEHYLQYVRAAVDNAPAPPAVLDVGCGVGWSSTLMLQCGFASMVVGVDIGTTFVDMPTNPNLGFVSADALFLPFPSQSFDVVAFYQFLEHVPDPGQALDEMLRVLKPGGMLVVAGPNLLSPLVSLQGLARLLLTRSPMQWFIRNPQELRSPFGNILLEKVFFLFRNMVLLLKKTCSPTVKFVFRTPDLREPAHADTDACYLLNPLDVRKYLLRRGLSILQYQDGGRLRLGKLGALKGGTWVVAVKPTTVG